MYTRTRNPLKIKGSKTRKKIITTISTISTKQRSGSA